MEFLFYFFYVLICDFRYPLTHFTKKEMKTIVQTLFLQKRKSKENSYNEKNRFLMERGEFVSINNIPHATAKSVRKNIFHLIDCFKN